MKEVTDAIKIVVNDGSYRTIFHHSHKKRKDSLEARAACC